MVRIKRLLSPTILASPKSVILMTNSFSPDDARSTSSRRTFSGYAIVEGDKGQYLPQTPSRRTFSGYAVDEGDNGQYQPQIPPEGRFSGYVMVMEIQTLTKRLKLAEPKLELAYNK
jgi:hypothetical protein